MEQRVKFYSQGLSLFANLHLPYEGAPCVLMSHGFESSKDGDKWLILSARFYDQGLASLRFNYRGCGEGDEKSGGEFEDTTLTERIKDYKAAIDYLQTANINPSRLGVIGSSLGGMIAIAAKDDRVKAIVTLATPSGPIKRFEEFDKEYIELGSGRKVKRDFYEDSRQYNICQDIGKIHCPILIIQGSLDEVVPVENACELYENANEPKRLEIVEGGNHSFDDAQHLEMVINLSLEWFKRYL